MVKKFIFRNDKYNIVHQDIRKGIEDRGYIDNNPINSSENNPLDKWRKYRAARDDQNIFPSSSFNLTRMQIYDAVGRLYDSLNYETTNISSEKEQVYIVGYNFNKQKVSNYVEEYLLQNPEKVLEFIEDPNQFMVSIPGVPIRNILNYNGDVNNTNSTLPLLKISGGIISGHHKDGKFERGLQGPFTEQVVGGYKHRHQNIGTENDRPERFQIVETNNSIKFYSPISSSSGINYNIPYSRFSREGFTKSPVNIKNIQITGANHLGNFYRNYQLMSGLHRGSQNLALVDRPENFTFNEIDSPYISGVVEYGLPDRRLSDGTYNKTFFVNKFGAPGDVNSTNPAYMDKESEEYSIYNTVNYRNSSPRYYKKTFLSIPSYFGGYISGSYGVSASYQKTQRNNRNVLISQAGEFKLREDNGYINFNIPARDGGYLWIKNYTTGGNNPGLYINGVDNDIIFISSSADNLYFSPIEGNYYNIVSGSLINLDTTINNVFRKYNIQYNGMWNFSTKKQLSQNYNKIINYNKSVNSFTDFIFDPSNLEKTKKYVSCKDSFIKDKHVNTVNVYEDKNKNNEEFSYSFGQDYCSFVSDFYRPEYNQIINLYNDNRNIRTTNKQNSLFNKLLEYDKFLKENNLDERRIKEIRHEEKIYPKSQNVYRNFVRIRNDYHQRWTNDLENRLTELANSQGQIYSANNFNKNSINPLNYSYWPLDANTYYDSITPASRDKSGELLQLDNPALYQTTIGSTYTIVVPSGSYYGSRFSRNWGTNRPANVVHEQAGRGPYHNSYEEFYSDIRLLGQGYSILPEYRISTKLDSYYKNNTSYYDDSFNILEITGTVIEDLEIATNTGSAFTEQRINSDYIDLLPYLNDELKDYKTNSIKLKIKTIKKLLPYDEFYPQKQMVNLANQFSSSYSNAFYLYGTNATFRTALTPFYAPGIAFNSIKSGVGMPFNVAISSSSDIAYLDITSSLSNASKYYQKLGWESILSPYGVLKTLKENNIYDLDPDIKMNSTASINSLGDINFIYDYEANNFYSEVVNFFKEKSSLTTIKSRPVNEWYFPDLNIKYALDIVLSKQGKFYTYSSYESYGPKPYAFHNPPWVRIGDSTATDPNFSETSYSPNAIGGEYAESYVRIIFDPASLAVGDLDYFLKGKFNIGDILRNSSFEYFSYTANPSNTSSYTVQVPDMVDIFNVSSDGRFWQPKLKWECPTADLNFYNLNAKLTNSSGNDSGAGIGGNAIRGIWHQYAEASNNKEGLFLSARNSDVNNLSLTGSLLDIVGFNPAFKQKIGTVADFKNISEAIILIPFYNDECGVDKFFDIDINLFERMYEQNTGIIGELKNISRNYNLPPSLDYIKYRDIKGKPLSKEEYNRIKSPFLMFGFEFFVTLDKKDLLDIWQGVMPKPSISAQSEYQEKEFFIGNYLKDLDYKLPHNTRFKVFKVKQRAVTNYQQIIDRTNGIDYLDLNYGYNWPYDYCSLVEMAEIKTELVYSNNLTEDQRVIEDERLRRNLTILKNLDSNLINKKSSADESVSSRELIQPQETIMTESIVEQAPTTTERTFNETTTTMTAVERTAINTQNVVIAPETTLTTAPVSAPSFTAPTSQPTSTTAQQSTFASNLGIPTQNIVVSNRTINPTVSMSSPGSTTTTTNNVE